MPKCTTTELEAELPLLKQAGFKCSAHYIEAEIKKRKRSTGKRATNDSPKHKQWREASAKYRAKQEPESTKPAIDKDFDFGS